MSAAIGLLVSSCASMQGATEQEKRFRRASLYDAFGAALVVSGVGGALGGIAAAKIESDANVSAVPGIVVTAVGLAFVGIGAGLIINGTNLWNSRTSEGDDWVRPPTSTTVVPALSDPSQAFLAKCYEKCRRTSWQVGICQRDCDAAARREDARPTATSSAAVPLK